MQLAYSLVDDITEFIDVLFVLHVDLVNTGAGSKVNHVIGACHRGINVVDIDPAVIAGRSLSCLTGLKIDLIECRIRSCDDCSDYFVVGDLEYKRDIVVVDIIALEHDLNGLIAF